MHLAFRYKNYLSSDNVVISTKWVKCSKLHPSLAQAGCRVINKTTNIGTNLKKMHNFVIECD